MKRTRLSVCRRKRRHASLEVATAVAVAGGWVLRPYRCDRCGFHHLTSRRKGHHTPAAIRAELLPPADTSGSADHTLC